MIARTVSLVLVAAIVGCPICCGSGWCHDTPCRSAKQAVEYPCSLKRPVSCGCAESQPDSDQKHPRPCPEDSTCQCICGGAVIERSCPWGGVADAFFLPVADDDFVIASRQGLFQSLRVAHDFARLWGGNRGRFMRTLHSSLLC
jgi:hypothetical protein